MDSSSFIFICTESMHMKYNVFQFCIGIFLVQIWLSFLSSLVFYVLGDSEITANLYCNSANLYWEGCVICSKYLRYYMERSVGEESNLPAGRLPRRGGWTPTWILYRQNILIMIIIRRKKYAYCMSKKSCLNLYSNLLYKWTKTSWAYSIYNST